MQYLFSLLPVLACPLGMGALMWFMMRGNKEQTPRNTSDLSAFRQGERRAMLEEAHSSLELLTPVQPQPSLFKTIWDCIQMCLNWKVLLGLVAVAALLGVLNPALFFTSLPTLLILVCPLSMGIMLLRMGRMRQTASSGNMMCCTDQTNADMLAEPRQTFEQPMTERHPISPLS